MRLRRSSVWVFAFFLTCPLQQASATELQSDHAVAAALQRLVAEAGDAPSMAVGTRALPTEAMQVFYGGRAFRPIWIGDGPAQRRTAALREALQRADTLGLDPRRFAPLPALAPAADAAAMATAELAYTALFLAYARDLGSGSLQPREVDREYALTPPPFDPVRALAAMAAADDARGHLAALAPADPIYRGLVQALAEYRALAAAGGWGTLPEGDKLTPGLADNRIPVLRRMLRQMGDAGLAESAAKTYDADLVQAVRRFQDRHGLTPDGVVGPATRAALNVPAGERVQQILVNMERWRWLPRDLGDPFVLVNMAGFDLRLVDSNAPTLTMRVVVGKPVRRTPVFSNAITYLEFNPTWTVPPTIAIEDLLPEIRRNPGLIAARGMQLYARGADGTYAVDPHSVDWSAVGKGNFPYRIRQRPGPRNPLGRVKFMFPNDFAIYLHDTPSRQLFQRSQRAFSSGCIRVEKPLELAERLLARNDGWSRARIDSVIDSGKTRTVFLESPVPIHLVYLTAWRDEAGVVQFREDLYGRDSRLLQAMMKNSA